MKTKFTSVTYRGSASVDPRFTAPMLSWTLADIMKAKNNQKLSLGLEDNCVVCYDGDFERQLCHPLRHVLGVTAVPPLSDSAKGHRGLVYLVRAPKDPLLHCHLFEAANPNDVTDLIAQMRENKRTTSSSSSLGSIPQHIATTDHASQGGQAPGPIQQQLGHSQQSLRSGSNSNSSRQDVVNGRIRRMPASVSCNSGLNDAAKDNGVSKTQSVNNLTSLCADISPSSSHFFEVLYVGKIKVSHKRVPDNFIDEALMRFRAYEAEKARLRQEGEEHVLSRRGSQDSSTLSLGSVESLPLSGARSGSSRPLGSSAGGAGGAADEGGNVSDGGGGGGSDQEGFRKLGAERTKGKLQRGQSQDLISQSSAAPLQRGRSASIGSIASCNVPHNQLGRLAAAHQADQNRTMVFQVGRTDLRLISPDRKQILMHKQLRDVSGCVQGIKNVDHFGFICRERPDSCYISYIFKCQSETVTDDVVLAISQAFIAGAEQYKSKEKLNNQVVSCEHCPMTWYHKLCLELEGLSERKVQSVIFRRVEQHWPPEEQTLLSAKYNGAGTVQEQSLAEQNAFLMALVRMHCETRQQRHVHDTTENRTEFINQYLGGSTIFMKAKRSLSNSFDHLLKRKGSKDDFAASIREFNMNREANLMSPTIDENNATFGGPSTPHSSGLSAARQRARNSTRSLDYSNGFTPDRNGGTPVVQLQSPMMDIFMKVGNTPKESREARINEESWRQAIFNKVTTPNKRLADQTDPNSYIEGNDEPNRKRTKEEFRGLWLKAINQALLLVRMERENARLKARQELHEVKRIKLEYNEIQTCDKYIYDFWEKHTAHSLAKIDREQFNATCKQGIPKSRRGEVWALLAERHAQKIPPIDLEKFPNCRKSYQALLQQLTSHQHAILIDLGRTFPGHAYFSSPLGPGQLSLFNILKAYSLLDPDVGYCQGLSFIAGVLLLHMDEPEAFFLLRHLMLGRGMRDKYLPDMSNLQLQLYQLSRLLRDRAPDLYEKFNEFDIGPTLYAAPWILTVFSSQFPLGFVTRVFDLLFLESWEVIFKFAMALLKTNKERLLSCDTFEEIMGCLKNKLPDLDTESMEKIMKEVFSMDISKQLLEYSVEYQVLQEEIHSVGKQNETIHKLEDVNRVLQRENAHLRSQLEISLMNEHNLENVRNQHQIAQAKLEGQVKSLEQMVLTLGRFISTQVELKSECEFPAEVKRIVHQLEQRRDNQKKSAAECASPSSSFSRKIGPLVKSKSMNSHLGDKRHELNLPLKSVDENLESSTEFLNHNNNKSTVFRQFNSAMHQTLYEDNKPAGDGVSKLNSYLKVDEKVQADSDSGISTPQTPLDVVKQDAKTPPSSSDTTNSDVCTHPLSNCDVSFTYNGTTKLKTIRPLRANLSRAASTDLLVEKNSCST